MWDNINNGNICIHFFFLQFLHNLLQFLCKRSDDMITGNIVNRKQWLIDFRNLSRSRNLSEMNTAWKKKIKYIDIISVTSIYNIFNRVHFTDTWSLFPCTNFRCTRLKILEYGNSITFCTIQLWCDYSRV